jgi:serine/threonine protein kinase
MSHSLPIHAPLSPNILSASDLRLLSRLLDQALELPPEAREAWLCGLSDQRLAPTLRQLLGEADGGSTATWMVELPALGQARNAATALPGQHLGPYRLIKEIGCGGMGTVWLADRMDGTFERQVALKLPLLIWGSVLGERMVRERQIGALLEHPHIARLYDAGVDGQGRPYIAFEYVDGVPLDEWCRSQGLNVRDKLTLFLQVIRAVAYAHSRLVVHRDLKPSNVLVSRDGQAHLLDFGIAKMLQGADRTTSMITQANDLLCTPKYASPEQLFGGVVAVASDIYSLGVMLYELFAGHLPYQFEHWSVRLMERALSESDPPLVSTQADSTSARLLRGEVDCILAKALKAAPGERYATAEAFADDIERHLQGERVFAQPDSLGKRVRRVLRRHRVSIGVGSAVVTAILSLALALLQGKLAEAAFTQSKWVGRYVVELFQLDAQGRWDPAMVSLYSQLWPLGNPLISYDEAQAGFQRTRSEVAKRGTAVSKEFIAAMDFHLGIVMMEWGDWLTARSLISQSAPVLHLTASSSDQRKLLAHAQGVVALHEGSHERADELFRGLISQTDQGPGSASVSDVMAYILVAINLDMQGRHEDAMAVLSSAPRGVQATRGFPDPDGELKSASARILLDSGRADLALKAMPPAQDDSSVNLLIMSDQKALRGEILCAAGQASDGLSLLEDAIDRFMKNPRFTHHTILARARAVAGICALARGQRHVASRYAASARSALDAQAAAPYFEQPLTRLERLLRKEGLPP